MKSLISNLQEYKEKSVVPLHMPGGKRNADIMGLEDPFSFDITEIEGFDNLHNAEGILKYEMERIADIYGSDESFICVNGSTSALIAAICGAFEKGDRVLVARNCHICIINAIIMRDLIPVFLYPEIDENGIYKAVDPEAVRVAIRKDSDIKGMMLTSPTYEGVISDIRCIADILHSSQKLLIVDEAHGAHFPFSDAFPEPSCRLGADAAVNSTHKTLPALTQTALLHLTGNRIDKDRVRAYWNMLQTTSPSYVLMGSMSACFDYLCSESGKDDIKRYSDMLVDFRQKIGHDFKHIGLFKSDDISKIVLVVNSGKRLYDDLLNKFDIQLEMASYRYVIGMTSVADKPVYYDRLYEALYGIDNDITYEVKPDSYMSLEITKKSSIVSPHEAFEAGFISGQYMALSDCAGKISADTIVVYPPGIPVIVAGEQITDSDIHMISAAIKNGFSTLGVKNEDGNNKIKILT